MIPDFTTNAEVWLLAAVIAAILCGSRLWRIAQYEQFHQSRLEAFRGAVRATRTATAGSPWYRRLGALVAVSSIVGTTEQQRLFKLLVAAGIKNRGSLA